MNLASEITFEKLKLVEMFEWYKLVESVKKRLVLWNTFIFDGKLVEPIVFHVDLIILKGNRSRIL